MSSSLAPTERLKKLFHRRAYWMLDDLARALGYALISVRRFLHQLGYCRSYTHNGKWYTLRRTPAFDREGLWHCRGIGFSQHGSLTATIRYLVERSPAGLSARELAQKLRHSCPTVLTHLHQDRVLDRVKVGGEFRYLAIAEPLNRQQREQAGVAPPPSRSMALNTSAAVSVLVASIKHPDWSFEELAAHLQHAGPLAVTAEQIRRFFAEHALKKTPAPPTSTP
jgi:DNA-binding CsgD family transcriptional regulator